MIYKALTVLLNDANQQIPNTKSVLVKTYNLRPRKPVNYK
jgi:hypothetical protein